MQAPSSNEHDALRPQPAPRGRIHPCAPALQFLTPHAPYLQENLVQASQEAFAEGHTLDQICSIIYFRAQAFGFEATIGVQEVFSTSMPSFRDQTVTSALLMIDLRPLSTPGDLSDAMTPHSTDPV